MGARRRPVQIRISAARMIRLPALARLAGSRKIFCDITEPIGASA
jgi:hypothetical protein